MRYFIDTEFIEDGKTIDLISIGIVSSDGREYYAQSTEFDPTKANKWVWENVFPHLMPCAYIASSRREMGFFEAMLADEMKLHEHGQCTPEPARTKCFWRTREQIKKGILLFCDPEQYGKPVFWGYYSAYDHVALCQLFGTMMDLPEGFPMYTNDLKQICSMLGNPQLPEQGKGEHNALSDARWNKAAYEFLQKENGERIQYNQGFWKNFSKETQ